MLFDEAEKLNEENTTHQSSDEANDIVFSTRKSKLLTREQEYELGYKALQGDIEARNALVEANYRLVGKIATGYIGCGVPIEDLYQEGCMGLLIAASKYDPSKKCRFSTYATPWIYKYIKRASSRSGFSTRVPRRIEPYINKVTSFARLFEINNERSPSVKEISESTGIKPAIVEDILRFITPFSEYDDKLVTLDTAEQNPGMGARSFDSDYIVSKISQNEFQDIVERILTDKEKMVFYACLYSDFSVEKQELSLRLSVNIEELKNIKKGACKKLQSYFAEHNLDFQDFLPN